MAISDSLLTLSIKISVNLCHSTARREKRWFGRDESLALKGPQPLRARACRSHGGCPWCEEGRQHTTRKHRALADDSYREWEDNMSRVLRHGQKHNIREDGRVEVTGRCFVTGKTVTIEYDLRELCAWLGGEMIQDAMPHSTPEEREFLLSGTSPEGWEQMFGGADDPQD